MEFQIDRAWNDKWSFNASYLWSKSSGNFEGPVNSDTGYNDTNLVQYYDHPAVNERYGPTFNDYRHQIKMRGAYKLNDMWTFGGTNHSLRIAAAYNIPAFNIELEYDRQKLEEFIS